MKDYYYILGIDRNSSVEDIKNAYRKLSKKFHPDMNGGDRFFEERFKEINEAYEVLVNLDSRQSYDNQFGHGQTSQDFKRPFSKPTIIRFEVDKKSIYTGEEVTFTWQTTNATNVEIKPFGSVQESGSKTYRLNNLKATELTFELIASNEVGSAASQIKVFNKIITDVTNNSTTTEFTLTPAHRGLRLANFIIDNIFIFIIAVILYVILQIEETDETSANLIWIGTTILYYWILESTYGQTFGKFFTSTKVVTRLGDKPTAFGVLGRTACRFIPFEVLSNFGTAWHDSLSYTLVVKTNGNSDKRTETQKTKVDEDYEDTQRGWKAILIIIGIIITISIIVNYFK